MKKNKGSILLEYFEKRSWRVYEDNDRNKIKLFQKDYCRGV